MILSYHKEVFLGNPKRFSKKLFFSELFYLDKWKRTATEMKKNPDIHFYIWVLIFSISLCTIPSIQSVHSVLANPSKDYLFCPLMTTVIWYPSQQKSFVIESKKVLLPYLQFLKQLLHQFELFQDTKLSIDENCCSTGFPTWKIYFQSKLQFSMILIDIFKHTINFSKYLLLVVYKLLNL